MKAITGIMFAFAVCAGAACFHSGLPLSGAGLALQAVSMALFFWMDGHWDRECRYVWPAAFVGWGGMFVAIAGVVT